MTLQEYQLQRRDFNFRSRKKFTRYTPSQWANKSQEVEEESEHDEQVEEESEHNEEVHIEEEDQQAFAPRKGARRVVAKKKAAPNSALRRLQTEGASSPELGRRRRKGRQ